MALQMEVPDELDTGAFLEAEGVYHFGVIWATEEPKKRFGDKKGEMLTGFELEFQVMAGPHEGKTFRSHFQDGNLSHRDGGLFARQLQGRMLEAIAVTDPSKRGKTVTIELTKRDANGDEETLVAGRQFIGKIKKNKDGYLELSPNHIWHIDDPRADKCERNDKAIAMLPKEWRRSEESFKAKPASDTTNGNGHSNGNSSQGGASKPTAAPSPPPAEVNVDDI